MTTGHGRLPAGWYRDPVGMHVARYWDGSHWTRETKDAWDGEEDLHSLIDVWRPKAAGASQQPDAGQIIDLRNVRTGSAESSGAGSRGGAEPETAVAGVAETQGQTLTKVAGEVDLAERVLAVDLLAERPVRSPAPATGSGSRSRDRLGEAAPMMRAGRLVRLVSAVGIFLVDVALYLKLRSG